MRALKGFRRLAPTSSRYPLPRLAVSALVMMLLTRKQMEVALVLVVGFLCYLGPSGVMV